MHCHWNPYWKEEGFLHSYIYIEVPGSPEILYTKIKYENPYVMFFTGDFNVHSQNWWPDGNTNNEGIAIDNLLSALDLNQIIREPTIFEEKKNPYGW